MSNWVGYRSPKTLSRLAIAAISVFALLVLMAGFVGIAQITTRDQVLDLGEGDSISMWLLIQGLLALLQFPTYIAAVVLFLMWLYRTYVNLPGLRSNSREFTAGWAIGWWFIPFANLVKPFQVVRNVWSESDPDLDPNFGLMSSIQSGAPAFMGFWWAFWILANIASRVFDRVYDPEDASTNAVGGYVIAIAAIFWLIATGLVIKVITEITDRQEQRYARMGPVQEQAPPPPPTFYQNV